MREYRFIDFWWAEHPSVRALICMFPDGRSFIVKRGSDDHKILTHTKYKVSLHGVIE